MWLELGNNNRKRSELAGSHLLLACEKSVRLNKDVIERAKSELAKIKPDELAQFEILLEVPRSARAVVDMTLNNANHVSGDNAELLLEAAVYAAGESVAAKEKDRRERMKKEYEERISLQKSNLD